MKKLLTIGTSHVESGHDFINLKENMGRHDPSELFFKTWPGYLQTKLTDTKVYNLGVSGHGLDFIISRTYSAIDYYTPDSIILELPSITRFTITNDDYPYTVGTPHDIYSLSHIQSDDEFYWCRQLYKRAVMTAGIQPADKNYSRFHQEWLENIDEYVFINHLTKFKMLCHYIQSQGIELHTFRVNGDAFQIDDLHIDFTVDTDVIEGKSMQSFLERNGVWEYSIDGTGHAGWNTEQWMVDNIFAPAINKKPADVVEW